MPILRELWSIKDELADECNRDLRCLFDKLESIQKSARPRPVNRTANRRQVKVSR